MTWAPFWAAEPAEAMEDVVRAGGVRCACLTGPGATHVPLGQVLDERVGPRAVPPGKIQLQLGAMPLDAVDEQIIRVEIMGHDQIIDSRHEHDFWWAWGGV